MSKKADRVYKFGGLMGVSMMALMLKEEAEGSDMLTKGEKEPLIDALQQFIDVVTDRAVPLLKTIIKE